MNILFILIVGAAAGWLGNMIFSGSSLGIIGNIIVGIFGSFIGYWLLGLLGVFLGTGIVGAILTGAIGSIVILILLNLIFKGKKA